jgi:hypothetical protein
VRRAGREGGRTFVVAVALEVLANLDGPLYLFDRAKGREKERRDQSRSLKADCEEELARQ